MIHYHLHFTPLPDDKCQYRIITQEPKPRVFQTPPARIDVAMRYATDIINQIRSEDAPLQFGQEPIEQEQWVSGKEWLRER